MDDCSLTILVYKFTYPKGQASRRKRGIRVGERQLAKIREKREKDEKNVRFWGLGCGFSNGRGWV